MSVYGDDAIDHLVKIDMNHAEWVRTLVMCHKPRRVLEFGFGSGEATRAILAGLHYNLQDFTYTLVDNWLDFGDTRPEATYSPIYDSIDFITQNEYDFILRCKARYDFVFSDADHYNSQQWFNTVYEGILEENGILLYHDVTNAARFPNLRRIYDEVLARSYHHILLNQNSLPGERCDRGLLTIFKH